MYVFLTLSLWWWRGGKSADEISGEVPLRDVGGQAGTIRSVASANGEMVKLGARPRCTCPLSAPGL